MNDVFRQEDTVPLSELVRKALYLLVSSKTSYQSRRSYLRDNESDRLFPRYIASRWPASS